VLYARGEEPLRLCADDGECFLELVGAPVQQPLVLELAAGAPPRAVLTIREAGFSFRGFVDATRLRFDAVRPTVLGGYFMTGGLYPDEAALGRLRLAVHPGSSVYPAAPLSVSVACDEVSPYGVFVDYSDRIGAAGITGSGRSVTVKGGGLPLSASPGGAALARLELDGQAVEAHQSRAGFTRVSFLSDDDAFVFGWVPSSALTPVTSGVGFGSSGQGDTWVVGPEPDLDRACAASVPLFVEVGARRLRIGEIAARAPFRLGARVDPDLVVVEPPAHVAERDRDGARKRVERVRLVAGARLLLRRADAMACAEP
jgi:hypothetical protein